LRLESPGRRFRKALGASSTTGVSERAGLLGTTEIGLGKSANAGRLAGIKCLDD
jgi:hypothetical protein